MSSLTQPGNVLWALTDNLGTVRDLAEYNPSTQTTSIVNHQVFSAFGQLESQTNLSNPQAAAVDCVFGFTGELFDTATGLQNNLNRWFDAATGTWLSQDPKGFAAGDANLQRYVGNGPTYQTDPMGLQSPAPVADPNGLLPAVPNTSQPLTGQDGASTFTPFPWASGGAVGYNPIVMQGPVGPSGPMPWPSPASVGKGIVAGAVGAVIVVGVAAGAVAIRAPAAVVTGGIFIIGLAGAGSTAWSIYQNPTPDNIGYNVGALVGGAIVGGAAGRGVASRLSPPKYQPIPGWPAWGLSRMLSQKWEWSGSYFSPSNIWSNVSTACGTGPERNGRCRYCRHRRRGDRRSAWAVWWRRELTFAGPLTG